jgi:hypothetical protein
MAQCRHPTRRPKLSHAAIAPCRNADRTPCDSSRQFQNHSCNADIWFWLSWRAVQSLTLTDSPSIPNTAPAAPGGMTLARPSSRAVVPRPRRNSWRDSPTVDKSAPAPEINRAHVENRQKVCQHLPTLFVSKCRFLAPRTFLLKQRFKPSFIGFP